MMLQSSEDAALLYALREGSAVLRSGSALPLQSGDAVIPDLTHNLQGDWQCLVLCCVLMPDLV